MDRYAHGAYYAIAVGKPSEDTWAGGDGGMAYVLGTGFGVRPTEEDFECAPEA